MAASHGHATYKATGTTGSSTVDVPSGLVDGSLVLVFHNTDTGGLAAMGISGGTGTWNTGASLSSTPGAFKVYWKRVVTAASEPTTYTITQASGADGAVTAIRVADADPSVNPVFATPVGNTANGATIGTPGVTPTNADDLEYRMACGTGASGTPTWFIAASTPSFTNLNQVNSGDFANHRVFYRTLTSSAATGSVTATSRNPANTANITQDGSRQAITVAIAGVTGPTPKSLSDTGSSTETFSVSVTTAITDTGSAVDTISVVKVIPLADSGTAADTLSVTVTTALSDSGTGTQALAVSASLGLTDTASSTDTLTSATTKALADSGTGNDGIVVNASATLADNAVGGDSLNVSATVALGDTATGTQSFASSALVSLADTGSGTQALSIVITVPLGDTGTSAETTGMAATMVLADAGTAVESIVSGSPVSMDDSGAGTDTIGITAAISLAETASHADTVTATVITALSETGNATDTITVTQGFLKTLSDTATGTDSLSVAIAILLSDSAVGGDSIARESDTVIVDISYMRPNEVTTHNIELTNVNSPDASHRPTTAPKMTSNIAGVPHVGGR